MSFNGSISSNQNIQVVVRCRPPNPHEQESILNLTENEIKISRIEKAFAFDRVFDDTCSQFDVYKTVAEPLIKQVLLGFNCTIFAYGQTGTGKTYTMEGKHSDQEFAWQDDPFSGIIPRSLNQLFDVLTNQEKSYEVHVSFLELYNEEAYDLLSSPDENSLAKLRIYDDANRKGSVIIGGLKEIEVKSKSEIYTIFRLAASRRQTAATQLNACSSRSHTIFSVIVRLKEGSIGDEFLRIGKFNLVDLAGSECVGRSGAKSNRAREAGSINQSLLTLGRVITALVEKAPHIPYRESKLTRILQDSLGGTTKTSIIATISPAITDLEDTCSTLEYAQRAKNITNKPEINQQLKQERSTLDHNREIQALMDRHHYEMSAIEMKIRNEITDEWKAANERLEQQYASSTQDIIDRHKTDIAKLSADIHNKDEEIQNLKLDIAKLASDIRARDEENQDLKLDIAKLLSDTRARDEENKNLKLEIAKLSSDIHDRDEGIQDSKLHIAKLLSDTRTKDEENQNLKLDNARLASDLRERDGEIQSLKLLIQEKDEDFVCLDKRYKICELDKAKLSSDIEELDKKNKSLERLIRVKDEKLTLQDERHQQQITIYEQKFAKQAELEAAKKTEDTISKSPSTKTQTRVRKVMPAVAESDYANLTFDDAATDELAQFSKISKKRIKTPKVNGLSGKKRKIVHEKTDLSPLEQPVARTTRSRARKKLDF